jgi:radical SAM protein with 4Fe4S-binding SPASM domain
MTIDEFNIILNKLQGLTEHIYFHLMGEPLCHPQLEEFLAISHRLGFRVILTTNGTLLPRVQEMLLNAPALHKVNVSLHAFESNDFSTPFETYLTQCLAFGQAAQGKKLVVYRLWNHGGKDKLNRSILEHLHQAFPGQWTDSRQGHRMAEKVYLEYGDKFDWPDLTAEDGGKTCFCYGLRDQIGVLCDGSVVPCCLDHEGDINLGNLHREDMETILNSPRAQAIYHGFSGKKATEDLCRRCGYARRFL